MTKKIFCITFFDEYDEVLNTIKNIKSAFKDEASIVLVNSECEDGNEETLSKIIESSDFYQKVENLYSKHSRFRFNSHSVSRNCNIMFNHVYESFQDFDYVVFLFGDTMITDASNFDRRFEEMKKEEKSFIAAQAIGQEFHASTANPEIGLNGGRFQHTRITDVMPQYILIDGKFARNKKVLSEVLNTNELTVEQCMGDAILKCLDNDVDKFHKNLYRLNGDSPDNAYYYSDGIIYNAKDKQWKPATV